MLISSRICLGNWPVLACFFHARLCWFFSLLHLRWIWRPVPAFSIGAIRAPFLLVDKTGILTFVLWSCIWSGEVTLTWNLYFIAFFCFKHCIKKPELCAEEENPQVPKQLFVELILQLILIPIFVEFQRFFYSY